MVTPLLNLGYDMSNMDEILFFMKKCDFSQRKHHIPSLNDLRVTEII